MKRTAVNPWSWSLQYGFNQGELIEGSEKVLICSGQTAIDTNGNVQHAGDIRGQIGLALDNLDAVLRSADMTLSNVVKLVVYTTDVDAMIQNFDVLVGRLDAANIRPPQTLLGVARLAYPELQVELEATAMS